MPVATAAWIRCASGNSGRRKHSGRTSCGTCTSLKTSERIVSLSRRPNAIGGPESQTTTSIAEGCKLALQFSGFEPDHRNLSSAQFVDHFAVRQIGDLRCQLQADPFAIEQGAGQIDTEVIRSDVRAASRSRSRGIPDENCKLKFKSSRQRAAWR